MIRAVNRSSLTDDRVSDDAEARTVIITSLGIQHSFTLLHFTKVHLMGVAIVNLEKEHAFNIQRDY